MVSMTASPAAAASGLPPKVEPCCPAVSRPETSGPNVTSAPIGTPPPSPLATVMASGTIPACWNANHVPVRPIPVWISSTTRSAPCSVVSSRASRRYAVPASRTPASPWMASSTTAPVSGPTAARSAASSPYGTWLTPGMSGANGSR